MTRTLRFGRWPSGVRIALLIGLAVVAPCILLVVYGLRADKVDRDDAGQGLRARLAETLRRDVVTEVADRLDGAVLEAARHAPAAPSSDPGWPAYVSALEGEGGSFEAVYAITGTGRIYDGRGTLVWTERSDPIIRVDPAAKAALRARIVAGEALPEHLEAFAKAQPIGLDEGDYPMTLGYLHLRAEMLAEAGSPAASAACVDFMEALIRHERLISMEDRSDYRSRAAALRARLGDGASIDAGAARARRKRQQAELIASRIRPRLTEYLTDEPGHEVVSDSEGGRSIYLWAPVRAREGGEPRILLVLVLDRDRFERSVLAPALTGLALPPGFRAVRLGSGEDGPANLRVAAERLAGPLDDVDVAVVAEAEDAIEAAVRSRGNRNLVILVLAIVGAAAAGWLTLRTVTGELRLAKRTSDFVSNVTHELKTPLTAIRMFTETLQDGRVQDDSERRECLDVIARETDRLQERIERVLKMARLGAEGGSFDRHPGLLTDVLREAAETCRVRLAGLPGAELTEEIEEDLGPLSLDRRAIGDAVANLLANAVKYSPKDRCRLSLTGRKDGDEVVVEVRDDGYGIPASEHERIFERFYRIDVQHVRDAEGTGLGLALVRRIVEAHGGRISLKSAEGAGSTFRIHLPLARGGKA